MSPEFSGCYSYQTRQMGYAQRKANCGMKWDFIPEIRTTELEQLGAVNILLNTGGVGGGLPNLLQYYIV